MISDLKIYIIYMVNSIIAYLRLKAFIGSIKPKLSLKYILLLIPKENIELSSKRTVLKMRHIDYTIAF